MNTLKTMRRFLPLAIGVLLVIVFGIQVVLSQVSEASTFSGFFYYAARSSKRCNG